MKKLGIATFVLTATVWVLHWLFTGGFTTSILPLFPWHLEMPRLLTDPLSLSVFGIGFYWILRQQRAADQDKYLAYTWLGLMAGGFSGKALPVAGALMLCLLPWLSLGFLKEMWRGADFRLTAALIKEPLNSTTWPLGVFLGIGIANGFLVTIYLTLIYILLLAGSGWLVIKLRPDSAWDVAWETFYPHIH